MTHGFGRGPSATAFDLEDLVTEAWRGAVRVPHFQRDFRWGRQDVIRLFDSVLKGYPIGSLLLWRREANQKEVQLGALTIDAPPMSHAMWVVDGQQRIVSLANALSEDGHYDSRFALGFDLAQSKFVPSPGQPDPWVVPLYVIFDLERLIQWFSRYQEVSDKLSDATRVAKLIRQFNVPAYTVTETDEEVLTDIFDRMNNYGKRLSRAEIFSSLYAGDEASHDSRLDIDLISDHIDAELQFGVIDDDTVLRAILARRGPDVTREIRTEFSDQERRGAIDFRGEGRDAAYEAGQEALRTAVSFLQQQAGVPHVGLLAYKYLLVVLTRVFAHYPAPNERSLHLLRIWFWRAALAGPEIFPGSVTGGMRQLCSQVVPNDLDGSIQGLLEVVDRGDRRLPDLRRFRTNEAATKMILCSWWDNEPRSLITGDLYSKEDLATVLIDRSTAADAVRHVFRRLPSGGTVSTWAGNRLMLPGEAEPVSELQARLVGQPIDLSPETWKSVLASHCIPQEAVQLLKADPVAFVKQRQLLLAKLQENYFSLQCEWEYETTPSLNKYILDDLDEDEDDGFLAL